MHEPELQLRVRLSVMPQPPAHERVSVSVVPGEQVALVAHEPVIQPPHVHDPLHVRVSVRVPSPHSPHAIVRISAAPAPHSPSPTQAQPPHVQSALQRRSSVPQFPHAAPVST